MSQYPGIISSFLVSTVSNDCADVECDAVQGGFVSAGEVSAIHGRVGESNTSTAAVGCQTRSAEQLTADAVWRIPAEHSGKFGVFKNLHIVN